MAKANKAKYRLTCLAPEELSTYNKEYNQMIRDVCFQNKKFQPSVGCAHSPSEGKKCPYLEIKRLT